MTPDYEAIERKVEADMVKTELEPVPGDWCLNSTGAVFSAAEGRCCLFSPQLLGKRPAVSWADQVADILRVDLGWVANAIFGFDGWTSDPTLPGYAFGAEMRRKYVKDPAAAQEAADTRLDAERDR